MCQIIIRLTVSLGNRPRSVPSFSFIVRNLRYRPWWLAPRTQIPYSFYQWHLHLPNECVRPHPSSSRVFPCNSNLCRPSGLYAAYLTPSLQLAPYYALCVAPGRQGLAWQHTHQPRFLCHLPSVWSRGVQRVGIHLHQWYPMGCVGHFPLSFSLKSAHCCRYIHGSTYAKYYFALRAIGEKSDFRRKYNAIMHVRPVISGSIEVE